jgi:NAD(P)-dependent dehydrogenase (short-subunit alcohol dehydrogenase family)
MPMGARGHGATFCEVPPMTPPWWLALYGASKAAGIALTRAAAMEYALKGSASTQSHRAASLRK